LSQQYNVGLLKRDIKRIKEKNKKRGRGSGGWGMGVGSKLIFKILDKGH
jgi:hypothetical protein